MNQQYTKNKGQSPFQYLLALQAAVRMNRQTAPAPAAPTGEWAGVMFRSGDQVLLTPLTEVNEILRVDLLAPVPGVKTWVRGMTTNRGELFPVTDLQGFLNKKLSVLTSRSRILMTNFQEGFAGILVDRVLGLQYIPLASWNDKILSEYPALAPFMIGSFTNENFTIPIISHYAMIQHPRFRDVALREEEIGGVGP